MTCETGHATLRLTGVGDVQIRSEIMGDSAAIAAVNDSAFGSTAESGVVAVLRRDTEPLVSLVIERGPDILGHILFSPVAVDGHDHLVVMGLGPMAVLPRYQRKGLGSLLVRAGLEECRKLGVGAVVVLGHPEYYPRFGFRPASCFGLGCEYDVPDEVFMATELRQEYFNGFGGTVRYHAAFRDA